MRRVKSARYPDTLFPVWRYRHLHKVFGKLGISSRRGLFDALPSRAPDAAPV